MDDRREEEDDDGDGGERRAAGLVDQRKGDLQPDRAIASSHPSADAAVRRLGGSARCTCADSWFLSCPTSLSGATVSGDGLPEDDDHDQAQDQEDQGDRAATHGDTSATTVTTNTATSSSRLTMMLLTGSGEVLTATRVPAFTRCDAGGARRRATQHGLLQGGRVAGDDQRRGRRRRSDGSRC